MEDYTKRMEKVLTVAHQQAIRIIFAIPLMKDPFELLPETVLGVHVTQKYIGDIQRHAGNKAANKALDEVENILTDWKRLNGQACVDALAKIKQLKEGLAK